MELLGWIFFGPAKLLAELPYSGIVIAVSLIALQAWLTIRKRGRFERDFFREPPVFAGLLWLMFNLYELQLAAVLSKNGIAGTLRMDLIILVPILYVLTLAAAVSIRAQITDKRHKK